MTNSGYAETSITATIDPAMPTALAQIPAIPAVDVEALRKELRQARILIEILTNSNRGLAERLAWEKLVNQEDAAKPKA